VDYLRRRNAPQPVHSFIPSSSYAQWSISKRPDLPPAHITFACDYFWRWTAYELTCRWSLQRLVGVLAVVVCLLVRRVNILRARPSWSVISSSLFIRFVTHICGRFFCGRPIIKRSASLALQFVSLSVRPVTLKTKRRGQKQNWRERSLGHTEATDVPIFRSIGQRSDRRSRIMSALGLRSFRAILYIRNHRIVAQCVILSGIALAQTILSTFFRNAVSLSVVYHIGTPCLNWWTDLAAIWQIHSWGQWHDTIITWLSLTPR